MSYNRPGMDEIPNQRPQRTILNFDYEDGDIDKSMRESLLKESGHLTRSEQLIDEQFEVAVKTRESLVNQRWTIKNMQTQFTGITQQFGSVNELVRKIRLRKRRDTIIVAIVFSLCLGFLLYHLWL